MEGKGCKMVQVVEKKYANILIHCAVVEVTEIETGEKQCVFQEDKTDLTVCVWLRWSEVMGVLIAL